MHTKNSILNIITCKKFYFLITIIVLKHKLFYFNFLIINYDLRVFIIINIKFRK